MNDKKKEKKNEWARTDGEKKFYLFTAIGCAAVLIAIIVIAIAVSAGSKVEGPAGMVGSSSVEDPSGTPGGETPDDTDKPVVVVPESMQLPVATANLTNEFGFYHNKTLNNYYEHTGVDFVAEAGTQVQAVMSGKIESIYKDDVLLGTQIVVDHGEGLKTLYRFVTEAEGLKVGDEVEQGEVIATVAEANGNEYKDGAHLHFEVLENGKQVDPTSHLTLEEK